MQPAPESPQTIYEQRLAERRSTLEQEQKASLSIANLRLAVVVGGVVLFIASYFLSQPLLAVAAIVGTLVGFVLLVARHAAVDRRVERAERAVQFFERGLSRLDGTWRGHGAQGKRFLAPEHPYAVDFDLFGPASLFELICGARTMSGENTLADWLQTSSLNEAKARQGGVAELTPRLGLREELWLIGEDVNAGLDPEKLLSWVRRPPVTFPAWLAPVAYLFSVVTTGLLVAWLAQWLPAFPFLTSATAQGILAFAFRKRTEPAIGAAEESLNDLRLFENVLARLESEPLESDVLTQLQKTLRSDGESAAVLVGRLRTWVERLETRRNQWFAPIAGLLLWGTHCVRAIEAWRDAHGDDVPGWLDALGQLEAFSSLAGYAYENPDNVFPELLESGPRLDAEHVGHPLLDDESCVRNSLNLGACQLLMVSGSNMSGKSTLMRTIGVNAVLAYAGTTVRARRLALSDLTFGASICVQDSLQDGKSRFYAEIVRIRQLVELARGERPLLFFIDEMFGGTNSSDRRAGAEGVLRALVDLGAVGIVTSHDLALTKIADEMDGRAVNVHFQDELIDGRMHFDYTLRPGVVTKSNALELMRSIGLDV